MHWNKKISLFAISAVLVLVLLNIAPQVAFESAVDRTSSVIELQDNTFSLSGAPPPTMIAYWQFNEGHGVDVLDSIGPYIHGTTMGDPIWPAGVSGTCLELLDTQYVELHDYGDDLNLPEIVTIEAWVNLHFIGGLHTILLNSRDSSTRQFHFAIRDGRLYFEQRLGGIREVMSSPLILNTGEWYHVAVIFYRSAGMVWFYVNGNEELHGFPAVFTNAPGQKYMGKNDYHAEPGYLNGLIDEVAVYNNILDPATIMEHYQKGLDGLGYLEDPNTPPIAADDSYTIDEDTQLNVGGLGVLVNDLDDDGDSLEANLMTGPSSGSLAFHLDGTFTYIPNPDYSGIDSFSYRAWDGLDESNTATVTINVNPVNDAPIAADDVYSVNEDSSLNIGDPGILLNDLDIDDTILEVLLETGPSNGILTLNLDGSFNYLPNAHYFGPDYFTYRAFDGQDYSNIATVMITVNGVNDIPDANDDFYIADEGFTLFVDAQNGVLANDADVDGDSLIAELVDWPAFGFLTLNPDGSFEYFVDGWSGPVVFTYTAFDGAEYSPIASVIIDVIGDDDETGPEITITYSGGLTDGDSGTWTVTVDDPESGVDSVTVEIDSVIVGSAAGIYTVPNSLGPHTITVTATNADLDTGPSDQETSVLSDTVTIVDDDVTGPSIFITYTGDLTDINPGFWTVAVSDSISGVHSIIIEIDGSVVGTSEGNYAVPGIEGDHTITVTALNNDLDRVSDQETSILQNTVTIIATGPPESLIEITGETTGTYSDPVYLEARLIDVETGLPIPDKWIVFTLGTVSVDVLTDSAGIASYILILDQQPDAYMLVVSFAGDDDYLESSAMSEFIIVKECANLEYTGRTIIPTSDATITLMATVFDEVDDYWGDLTRIYVTFTLYLSSESVYTTGPIMVLSTDVDGIGLAIAEIPNLNAGEYLVVVSLDPLHNFYYYGFESESTVSVYEPERESIKGAGWIKDADGNKVFFVFHVRYHCRGYLKGFFFLTYRVNEWVFFIRSTKILSLSVEDNHGFFEVEVKISQYNLDTHEKVCSDERYRLRVDAWDNKKSHEDDAIQLRVFDKNGLVEYEVGFEPYGELKRGNIKITDHRKRFKW